MTTGGEIIFEEWKLFSIGRETVRKLNETLLARSVWPRYKRERDINFYFFFIFKSTSGDVNLYRVERGKLR